MASKQIIMPCGSIKCKEFFHQLADHWSVSHWSSSWCSLVLQLMRHLTYALNKIEFMTSINLLHVLALGCHHQGVTQKKGVKAQHTNLGIISPSYTSVLKPCKRLILAMNCISLNASVGLCINCKNMHDMSNIKSVELVLCLVWKYV